MAVSEAQPLTRSAPRAEPRTRDPRSSRAALLFTGPFFVLFILFLLWPVLSALWKSLFNDSLTGASSWAGLDNYSELLKDSNFWASMWHTLLFTLLSTPPLVLIALGLALLVSRARRLQWLWRLAFFAPYVLPVSVVVLIWNWMYQPGFGLINSYLTGIGLSEVNWLGQPFVAMVSVVIATVWWTVGSTSCSTSPACRRSRASCTRRRRSTAPRPASNCGASRCRCSRRPPCW